MVSSQEIKCASKFGPHLPSVWLSVGSPIRSLLKPRIYIIPPPTRRSDLVPPQLACWQFIFWFDPVCSNREYTLIPANETIYLLRTEIMFPRLLEAEITITGLKYHAHLSSEWTSIRKSEAKRAS
ncbi:hypothetical protein AVEN_28180-1 [Araneus ventricosus]|uniref:Uncharacterized protein n=1 Tax=Araneus ventricosus TaxID=182803 RepID=A0A4Y2IBR5_ARAVE|nr:hypothetical protein AVEN_28180-1 [Araneus ventricosus]